MARIPPLSAPLVDDRRFVMRGPWSDFFQPEPIEWIDRGPVGSAAVVDWSRGRKQIVTLTASCAVAIRNGEDGGQYLLAVRSGSGGFAVTWPASVAWPGGVAPTVTLTPGKCDLVRMTYCEALGVWFSEIVQGYAE
ncbi:hypothetical protein LLG88_13695 [bacterium]|nr:hypothetical protein [bacterium]